MWSATCLHSPPIASPSLIEGEVQYSTRHRNNGQRGKVLGCRCYGQCWNSGCDDLLLLLLSIHFVHGPLQNQVALSLGPQMCHSRFSRRGYYPPPSHLPKLLPPGSDCAGGRLENTSDSCGHLIPSSTHAYAHIQHRSYRYSAVMDH